MMLFRRTVLRQPDLIENVFSDGSAGLLFDGVDDFLDINNDATLNVGSHTDRSYFIRFRTSDNVTSRQILFEEGGNLNGTNVYIDQGEIHFSFYAVNF